MPKAKKKDKIKPEQKFVYKLTINTYGTALRFYSFKDIMRTLFKETMRNADWKPSRPHNLAKQDKQCSICFEDIKKNQHVQILDCKHEFHNQCFKSWCKSKAQHTFAPPVTCPLCRKKQTITYTGDFEFAAVTRYTVEDDDSVVIERDIIPQREFHA
jgi:hypothetical protein